MPSPLEHNLPPKKSLGQHFLRDPNTARKIVSSLDAGEDDTVVEIGPGTGALTCLLAETFSDVTAVEVDQRAAALIRDSLPSITVMHEDVLRVDWETIPKKPDRRLHIIGNLPYNITSQILFSLFDACEHVAEAVLMMQYEVARRLVAVPRTKAYGILSVAAQLVGEPRFLFPVSANVFKPKPDVRSAVVRIDFSVLPEFADEIDRTWTRTVIRTAFNQRRKTLRNSLRNLVDQGNHAVPGRFASKRAEELSPEDFVMLARYLQSGS